MMVETTVLDNVDGVPLKKWLAAQEWQLDLTNDIPLDGIVGVRVLREEPAPGIQEMSGYYQEPLGKIYVLPVCIRWIGRWSSGPSPMPSSTALNYRRTESL
ncbi:hypothetical protein ACFLYD_04905 [Chloroflexota bacterium]